MVAWLREYFKHFSRKSLTAQEMIVHFENFFKDVQLKVDWNEWLHGTTLPDFNATDYFDKKLYNDCVKLAKIWQEKGGEGASADDLKWDSAQSMCFLDLLLTETEQHPLSRDVLNKMEALYQLNSNKNCEIVVRWYLLNLENDVLDICLPSLEHFLSINGRGVYVKEVYKKFIQLAKAGKMNLDQAKAIYKKNRNFYHYVIRAAFDAQLL